MVCQVWDLRKDTATMTLTGHSDTITSLAVSPDGSHLLTNSMDNTLRMWDMRPYAPENRCMKIFIGKVMQCFVHVVLGLASA